MNTVIYSGQIGGLSSTYATSIFYSFTFTPKSTTSTIFVTFDGNCTMSGGDTDTFKCLVGTYNDVVTQEYMLHSSATSNGGGMRGTPCFPINACWKNTTLTAYKIGCYFDLKSSDDDLTFTTEWCMKLEEIKN